MESFSWRRVDRKNKFTAVFVVRNYRFIKERKGDIAQLGERLNGIQEVSGSIPLISTEQRQ